MLQINLNECKQIKGNPQDFCSDHTQHHFLVHKYVLPEICPKRKRNSTTILNYQNKIIRDLETANLLNTFFSERAHPGSSSTTAVHF